MIDLPRSDTLCERCSSLSFDDQAIGGREIVGADGVARLSFPESKIKYGYGYRLVRLNWELDDTIPDMPHLSHFSQLGCAFCRALRRSLEQSLAREGENYSISAGSLALTAYLALNLEGVEGLFIRSIIKNTRLDLTPSFIPILFLAEADSNCEKWLGAQSARHDSYLDPMNIGRIGQLLDHCTSKCHPVNLSTFLPTRLIDVGHDAFAVPRLVLSSDVHQTEQTRYAALSYCWGDEEEAKSQFKTEIASLEDRCVALSSELMTSTTKDAIALARAIGIRYLWIDALCIIQDDEGDWSHESSQMNLIYRHAFVTFCSLSSDSCHEGFLNRAPTIAIPFQSTIQKAIKGFYSIRARSIAGFHVDRKKDMRDHALSKWGTRGWTYQEQVMSTRFLLFGSLRMHFTCDTCQWAEGDEAPKDRSEMGISIQITRFKDKRISIRQLYEYWNQIVQGYCHRSVTFDKDRLPAIAGIARMIGEALQDQYLAGLWRGNLQCGLAWYSFDDGIGTLSRGLEAYLQNIRERNYVAPSWSWAALSAMEYEPTPDTCLFEESTIVDVSTKTISEDLYGQVSVGVLRIRAKMARMPNRIPVHEGRYWKDFWIPSFEGDVDGIYVGTDWLHKDKEAGLENLVVMLLHRIEKDDKDKAPSLMALLLHPANELKHYLRVGVMKSSGNSGYREMRAWFEDSQEETICII